MELIRLEISATFVMARVKLSWREVRFGIENELLDPKAAVEIAAKQLADQRDASTALADLASTDATEPMLPLVSRLADDEPPRPVEEIRNKWLYIVLAWLYEHRSELAAPLETVEQVYADFGYPSQIAKFVRYMPMEGPDLGSGETSEQAVLARWKQWLDEAATMYAS